MARQLSKRLSGSNTLSQRIGTAEENDTGRYVKAECRMGREAFQSAGLLGSNLSQTMWPE